MSDASIVRVEFVAGIPTVYLNDLNLPASRGLDPMTPGPFVTRIGNSVVDYELVRRGQGWNLTTTRIRLPLGTLSSSTGECRSIAALETLPRMMFKPAGQIIDSGNPQLLAMIAQAGTDQAGMEAAISQCAGCHTLTEGGANGFGPNLWGVVGAPVGARSGFSYSAALEAQNAAGWTWTYEHLDAFLHNPQEAVPGTTMPFGGIADDMERARVIAFLRTLDTEPMALDVPAGTGAPSDIGPMIAAADPVAGEAAAGQCAGCHTLTEGGAHGFGPNLWDVIGSPVGGKPRYAYSAAMQAQNAAGQTWTLEHFDTFIHNPQEAVPGTTMPFGGVADDAERHNIVAYFRTLSNDPVPLPEAAAMAPAADETPAVTLAFEDVGNPTLLAAIANGDAAAGEQVAMQCAGCHSLGEGGPNMFGPNLYGVVYRGVGTHEGFNYSPALAALGTQGAVWTYAGLDAFLTSPQAAIPGNTMPFGGIADATDRANLIAFLRTLSAEPAPVAFVAP